MEKPGSQHWSNCALPPRFFGIHALSVVPWILSILLSGRFYTIQIAIIVTLVLFWIEAVKRMTVSSVLRALNIWLTGREKPVRSTIKDLIQR